VKQVKKTKVLLEMRPALEGFAGIPQETRLLFRGLRMLDNFEVEGMIQTSHRVLAKGTSDRGLLFSEKALREERKINRYSRVVISVAERPYNTILDRAMDYMQRRMMSTQLTLSTVFGFGKVRLSNFRSKYFEDFIWRTLFSKTLPASDYALVSNANQRICHTPWHVMHMTGLATLNFLARPRYPVLSTRVLTSSSDKRRTRHAFSATPRLSCVTTMRFRCSCRIRYRTNRFIRLRTSMRS
jgi:hypothetical protein